MREERSGGNMRGGKMRKEGSRRKQGDRCELMMRASRKGNTWAGRGNKGTENKRDRKREETRRMMEEERSCCVCSVG